MKIKIQIAIGKALIANLVKHKNKRFYENILDVSQNININAFVEPLLIVAITHPLVSATNQKFQNAIRMKLQRTIQKYFTSSRYSVLMHGIETREKMKL